MAFSWSKLRVRSVWLIAIPFFWFASPTPALLAGGVALNSLANGRIQRELPGKLYIQPAAGDAGGANN